jgi:hypothetical protein
MSWRKTKVKSNLLFWKLLAKGPGLQGCTLRKNFKSETLIWDASTKARLRSDKVRCARVGVTQTWVEDGLYGDAHVIGASPFCNYHRRALAHRLLLKWGDTHWLNASLFWLPPLLKARDPGSAEQGRRRQTLRRPVLAFSDFFCPENSCCDLTILARLVLLFLSFPYLIFVCVPC